MKKKVNHNRQASPQKKDKMRGKSVTCISNELSSLLRDAEAKADKRYLSQIRELERSNTALTRQIQYWESQIHRAQGELSSLTARIGSLQDAASTKQHQPIAAESRLLEWFRKNAPEQLDPTGGTHLYDTCLRIVAEWHRQRISPKP